MSNHEGGDVVMSIPWECGDRDCPARWHQADYALNDDPPGTYIVANYGDGDYSDVIEEADMPSYEEYDRSWREYSRYVVKSGLDPLEEFYVKHSIKKKERWAFKFNDSIVGPVLMQARHGRKNVEPAELPERIIRYLNLNKARVRKLCDFEKWADLEAAQPGIRPRRWWSVEIDYDKPRSKATVKRELKRLARKHLREKILNELNPKERRLTNDGTTKDEG